MLYSPTSAGSCARSRSSRVCAAARAWRHASAGMRSRNGRRSSSACAPSSASTASPAAARAASIKTRVERRQIGEDPFPRLAACALGAGARPSSARTTSSRTSSASRSGGGRQRRRAATKGGEPADGPGDVRRQALPPSRAPVPRRHPAHADGPAPLVERVEHVVFAVLDAQRTAPCALGVVAFERTVDAVAGDLERNALLRPATHELEGRPHDANQVPVVLARQVRLDGAAVLVRRHSQVTSPPDDALGARRVAHEKGAVVVDACRDAAARALGVGDLDGGAGRTHGQLLPARAHDRGVSGAQAPHPGPQPREAGAEDNRGVHGAAQLLLERRGARTDLWRPGGRPRR